MEDKDQKRLDRWFNRGWFDAWHGWGRMSEGAAGGDDLAAYDAGYASGRRARRPVGLGIQWRLTEM